MFREVKRAGVGRAALHPAGTSQERGFYLVSEVASPVLGAEQALGVCWVGGLMGGRGSRVILSAGTTTLASSSPADMETPATMRALLRCQAGRGQGDSVSKKMSPKSCALGSASVGAAAALYIALSKYPSTGYSRNPQWDGVRVGVGVGVGRREDGGRKAGGQRESGGKDGKKDSYRLTARQTKALGGDCPDRQWQH